ncbi:MAG: hypothetical protein IPK85_21120 [Gemmatimonadetes bacterium]|nr:hypothetical protein [Gemmatimonadota bacterium]
MHDPMLRRVLTLHVACLLPLATLGAQGTTTPVERAIARMGGLPALQRIQRVRFEQMTLWHRQTFESRPFSDVVGSYERVSDLRDYSLPAWRNTRRPVSAAASPFTMTDLVRDSVAARLAPTAPNAPAAWTALNMAYVDERRELFTFAPDRVLLAARASTDLRPLADTLIDRRAYHRVRGTLDRFPTTLYFSVSDGLLARATYLAAHPADFGLAPYGPMEVDLWFGQWQPITVPGSSPVTYPMQWDIARLGVPYKRITLLSANFDAPAPPDSFVIADDTRAAYHSGAASRPMWDLPLDSARIIDGRFATLGAMGFPPAAVKVGNQWILLEGTAVPDRARAESAWLSGRDASKGYGAAIITTGRPIPGGATWFLQQQLPILFGSGSERSLGTILSNWQVKRPAPRPVVAPRWLRFDGDSLVVAPLDVPGAAGGLVLYVPSLRWVYHALAVSPLVRSLVLEEAQRRGWVVERIGHARAIVTPVPPPAR